ncbi:Tex family protein [Paludicola sp. MB14-C6]|uniref:Tex family protein n=1 Tax=Paludihabitans sp. MB14-C6 TaxID=3070656 RepID=UPI0027DE0DC9|nr:Tex family protein [Paludicola sp. MB14-C6]WMJ21882.1 Tex family protein [Paludicola sp. MB14-C6]
MDILQKITGEFQLKPEYASNIVNLIDEGNTIPFIARYRKELTGSMDDQVLREFSDRLAYLRGLEKRKEEVISSIDSQGKLNDELTASIYNATTLAEIEDIYRPYKPKRKTRASVARERGLEPLAALLLEQKNNITPLQEAQLYINEEVPTAQDALNGAMDIIAEDIADRADLRKTLRAFIYRTGLLTTKAVDSEAQTVYTMYNDYSEPINKVAGHRVLAINRGEREDCLKVTISIQTNAAIRLIENELVTGENESAECIKLCCADSFTRLIFPSLDREIRNMLFENASEAAIKVFSLNLRQLLLQPPVKGTITLGLDPAYRTGCKIAVVDDTGKVLDTTVVYPTPPQSKIKEAEAKLLDFIQKYKVTTISIGNGTASRESESFVANMIKENHLAVQYMVVSEAGASVYSASKLAAEEFPQFDVSIRSAVSIARRLQDPLAELVKIDPKSIGVGQYQHDMPKNRLDEALGGVVEGCVNQVGVDLNTASHSLLSRIAGINASVAKNIVLYREENGAFKNRKELLKVSKLGAKAFTQCAGFLRVSGGENVLDNTGVHPESYKAAEKLIKLCGYQKKDVQEGKIIDIKQRMEEIGLHKLSEELEIGEPTICDIATELIKPGRDPRDELVKPLLRNDILELKDLKRGLELKGTVRNIVDFGAFVDIGVHEDGLVHISQITNRYIKHPIDVLNVGDIVTVWVMDVDMERKRIALTMKGNPTQE